MSKIKLLLDVVKYLNSLANSVQAVADAMSENEPVDMAQQSEPAKESVAKKTTKVKEVKLEEVRAVLAKMSQAGMTAEVREIIKRYGADKLSEIDPKHYADILKDAEVLANG